jgi:hypothetical protein
VVVPAADGTTDFSVLQNELKGSSTKIVMVAFDLLLPQQARPATPPAVRSQGRSQKIEIIVAPVQAARRVLGKPDVFTELIFKHFQGNGAHNLNVATRSHFVKRGAAPLHSSTPSGFKYPRSGSLLAPRRPAQMPL